MADLAFEAWGDGDRNFNAQDRAAQVRRIEAGTSANPQAKTIRAMMDALAITAYEVDGLRTRGHEPDADIVGTLMARNASLARDLKLKDKLVVGLARAYANSAQDDFDGAIASLAEALRVAAKLTASVGLPENTDHSVATVRAEMLRLNEESGPERASAFLKNAIDRKSAEMGALLELGVIQDRMSNDPAAAANKIILGLRLEVVPERLFGQVYLVQDEWFRKGRDEGLHFDATVATYLARAQTDLAKDAWQTGASFNNLGNALKVVGQRQTGTDKLNEAVIAYRKSLLARPRDLDNFKWAQTQSNLGNALKAIARRERSVDSLHKAIEAYRVSLEVRDRETFPTEWAISMHNLGNALKALGQRTGDSRHLEEAAAVLTAALEERQEEKDPIKWAMTKHSLAGVLKVLGERDCDTERLEEAKSYFVDVLRHRRRDNVPLSWAMTQNNLGNVLKLLGERSESASLLQRAVSAYREALKERTREKVPIDWAETQNNLGNALKSLGAHNRDANQVRLAVEAYSKSLQERQRELVPIDWAMTQNNLGNAWREIGILDSSVNHLQRSMSALRLALEERTRDKTPFAWAITHKNIAKTAIAIFNLTQNLADLKQAAESASKSKSYFCTAVSSYYSAELDSISREVDELQADIGLNSQ